MHAALGVMCGNEQLDVWRPLHAQVSSGDGEFHAALRRHWHPQYGWGWQIAAVTGLIASSAEETLEMQALAARLNADQAQQLANRFGGWSYVADLGLTHLT